jgi:hypothetical protein
MWYTLWPRLDTVTDHFLHMQMQKATTAIFGSLQSFRGLIFADAGDHAHYTLYNRTYFAGLIFADSRLSAKTTKIRPHENFPLYGILITDCKWQQNLIFYDQ